MIKISKKYNINYNTLKHKYTKWKSEGIVELNMNDNEDTIHVLMKKKREIYLNILKY